MSATIDQRVVEMRFDNSQFESNVSTTMSTLDKLKQKLNLPGASKGLEGIDAAAKKVNMSGLGGAVDAVSAKFSALQVMGVTALANITNSAVNAGKSIIKSLTIDPVKTGFEEYETKMGSIQTILANTEHQGTTLNDVTRVLDELNTYADKTIYNFQQMTKNIGTFTAAGVDLETSARSIQGIANLAAVSGSTSQQASTAMYQLSQALATGTVKLMDWNSVVNAGMGGKVFQNALIRTAAVMAGAAEDVEAWQQKNIDAYGSFRDSLTQGEWLTSEVLTRTLEQFTMAAEEGSEEWEAFKKTLLETGYTEQQANEILKMANTATDAATKVKTLTQLLDTLKEAAQSGWAQTWELIVGDFEEAKAFFTELSDIFGGLIGESAERRNALFSGALSSNWDKLIGKINDAGIETEHFEEVLTDTLKNHGEDVDALIQNYGSLEEAFRKGAASSDILKEAVKSITGTLDDSGGATEKVVANLDKLTRTLWWGHSGEDVVELQKALDALGYDLGDKGVDGIIGNYTSKAIRDFQKANGFLEGSEGGVVGPKTIAALKEATKGMTELTGSVEDNAKSVEKTIDSWDALIDEIDKTSGRELLLESLMNVIKAIQRPLEAIGEAWRNTFAISPDQLYNAIEGLNKFTSKFVPKGLLDADNWSDILDGVKNLGIAPTKFYAKLSDTLKSHGMDVDNLLSQYKTWANMFESGVISIDHVKEALLGFDGISETMLEGGETVDKLRRTFEGLFAILDVVTTFVGGGAKIAFKALEQLLGMFDMNILDLTAGLGDAAVEFRNWVDSAVDFTKAFEYLSPYVTEFGNAIKDGFTTLIGSEEVQKVFGDLTVGLEAGGKQAYDALVAFGNTLFAEAETIFGEFYEIGAGATEGMLTTLQNGANAIWEFLGNLVTDAGKFLGTIDWGALFASGMGIGTLYVVKSVADALSALAAPFEGLGDLFEGVGKVLSKSARSIKRVINNFAKVVKGFSKVLNSIAFSIKVKAITDLAKVLMLLVGVVAIVSFIPAGQLWNAVAVVGALAAILVALAWATEKISKASVSIDKNGASVSNLSSGLVGVAASLLILALAVKMLGGMETGEYIQGFLGLVGMMGVLMLLLAAYGSLVKGKAAQNISKAGGMLLMMAASMMILVKVAQMIGQLTDNDMKKGAAFMVAFTAFVAALTGISRFAGKGLNKLGPMMLSISIAMGIMVGVVKLIGMLSPEEIVKGVIGMVVFGTFIYALTQIAKKAGKDVPKIGGMLVGIAGAMLIMIGVVKLISMLSPEEIIKGAIGIAAFAGIIWLLLKVAKSAGSGDMPKLAGTLLAMSLAIGILAGICIMLGYVDLDHLAKGVAAVGMLGLIMSLMIVATKGASECKGSIMAMAVAIGVMAVAVAALSMIEPSKLYGAVGALSILMGMFALMELASKNVTKSMGTVIVLAAVIAILGGVLYLLAALPIEAVMGSALAMSTLLLALSAAMVIISGVQHVKAGALVSMLALAGIIGAVGLIVGLLEKYDLAPSIDTAKALSTLLLSMSTTCLILAGVGMFSGAALTGALTMCEIMAGIGAFLAIMGGLVTLFPDLKLWVTEGLDLLNAICGGLGKALGNLFDSFLVGATDDLGTVADNLSGFMTKLEGFISGVTGLDSSFPTKAEALIDAVGSLMKAEFWGTISSWLPGSDDTLANFGTKLSAFGTSLNDFSVNSKDVDIDRLTTIIDAINKLASIEPPGDGLFGQDGIDNFGTDLVSFSSSLSTFLGNLSSVTIDTDFIDKVVYAATSLASIAIPEDGLFGFDGIDNFGTDLATFGAGLGRFFASLNGVTVDTTFVDSVVAATTSLASIVIPEDGFFGGDGIDNFGVDLAVFGSGLGGFFASLSGVTIDTALVDSVVAAATGLASIVIPDDGFFGTDGIDDFGANLSVFGAGMSAFFTALAGVTIDTALVDSLVNAVTSLASIVVPDDGFFGTDGIDNFGSDLEDFGGSIAAFADEVSEVDGTKLTSIATAVTTFTNIASTISALSAASYDYSGLDTLMTKIGELSTAFVAVDATALWSKFSVLSTAINSVVTCASTLFSLNNYTYGGVESFKTALTSLAGANVDGVITAFSGKGEAMAAAVQSCIDAMSSGIANATSTVSSAMTELVDSMLSTISSKSAAFAPIGMQYAANLALGIRSQRSIVEGAGESVANAATTAAGDKSLQDKMFASGRYIAAGLINGIASKWYTAWSAGYELGRQAAEGADAGADVNSPSKLTLKTGKSLGEGLVIGMHKMGNAVYNSGVSMAKDAIGGISKSVAKISDVINSDMDTQPTIRPVLDLSDIRAGAGNISALLGNGGTIGMNANVGTVAAMMSARGQNGPNDDVVSAINKLRNKLDNISNATYNINGVTYDDGSNVSNAVQDLIRYARIERRV